MKHVDSDRGLEREILFHSGGGHATSGGVAVTNCVVEVIKDPQAHVPVLSLRFYYKPYPYQLAEEMADHGRPAYDEKTAIGVELDLGPELAHSLIEQINAKWPELVNAYQEQEDERE